MKSYQIHFIRHGLTDGNVKGQYIGSTDLSLCEDGRKAVEELCENYEYPGASAFITSPMKRCTETLSIIYPQAVHIPIEDLRECDFGLFEGMTAKELEKSPSFAEWISGDASVPPLDGESGEHFANRVCSAFEQIVSGLMKTGTTSCVIMTHGGVISMLLSKYGLPQAQPVDWPCEPGCGYTVRIHPQLWASGRVMEVCSRLPYSSDDEEDEDEHMTVEEFLTGEYLDEDFEFDEEDLGDFYNPDME